MELVLVSLLILSVTDCVAQRVWYSEWSPCDPETGTKTRVETSQCPVDGGWSAWTLRRGSCNAAPCETGRSIFSRACNNPLRKNNGRQCQGSRINRRPCTTVCPVDGGWCPWTEWGPCSSTCTDDNATPITLRTRNCACPAPVDDGRNCPPAEDGSVGNSEVSFMHPNCDHLAPCPSVDGGWCPWTEWEPCSSTCTEDSVMPITARTRNCECPPPSGGGIPCPPAEDGSVGNNEVSFNHPNCDNLPQCPPPPATRPGETLGPDIDWEYTGPSTTQATTTSEPSTVGEEIDWGEEEPLQ